MLLLLGSEDVRKYGVVGRALDLQFQENTAVNMGKSLKISKSLKS